ncbi:MAG: nickel-dependent lactate racemase [Anaerolineales bacterium]
MQVELAYGRRGLDVEVPDDATVLQPQKVPGLADERGSLQAALRDPIASEPLRECVRPQDRVAIVFSDITRPMPNDRVLPILLEALDHVPRENILLLNALGTHRPQTEEELEEMLGPEIAQGYNILQHDAWDDEELMDLGMTAYDHRALISRYYMDATYRILTGFIEPHFFAGFSGGPKAVMPGIAGFESIMDNHGYEMLKHPLATWGRLEGNPVYEETREVAAMTEPDFLLNVTLNRQREITGVFAGDLWQAHARGTDFVARNAMVPVEGPYDIVLTTNSGYPLDINLYQSVKGMSAAMQIVKPGGSIVIAAECQDGVPEWGEYGDLVHEAGSVQDILDIISQPGYRRRDQWEAQIQAIVQQKADVYVYSDGLSDEQTRRMLLNPCHDIEDTLADLRREHGPGARLCVLPEGPQTIPYLVEEI